MGRSLLRRDEVTMADVFAASGYRTAIFGKWHLGNDAKHLPDARGYDKAHMYAGGGFYHPKFVPEYKSPEGKRLSEVLTDMGIDFIKENKKKPFLSKLKGKCLIRLFNDDLCELAVIPMKHSSSSLYSMRAAYPL